MAPRSPASPQALSLRAARALWQRGAGLDGAVYATAAGAARETGWPRTLGGVDVYLALRARVPGLTRTAVDDAVKRRELQLLPAVRGCIYLVPSDDAPLALRVAERHYRPRAERELAKAGVRAGEIEEVGSAVLDALRRGPLSTDQLRRALPQGVLRSLGDAGKKVGISSTLPPALRHLELEGRVARTPEGGRLDTERYLWALAPKRPAARAAAIDDPIDQAERLAVRFFRQAGPARVDDFVDWSGCGKRDAAAAMARLPLVAVRVEGYADEAWLFEEALAAGRAARPAPAIALLPFGENLITHHGGPAPLTDPAHHGRKVETWGSAKPSTLGAARHVSYRPLVVDGDLAGFWEFDPDEGEVVTAPFAPLPAKRRPALAAAARDTARFLREELGHGRSFSIDTEEDLRRRSAALRSSLRG